MIPPHSGTKHLVGSRLVAGFGSAPGGGKFGNGAVTGAFG
jgi:hypothetical protein